MNAISPLRWATLAQSCAVALALALNGCGGCGSSNHALPIAEMDANPRVMDAGKPEEASRHDAGLRDVSSKDAPHDAGSTTLSLPQFIHGAARVDTTAFPSIPIVIAVSGIAPDSVEMTIDGVTSTPPTASGTGFVTTIDAVSLAVGPHAIVVKATHEKQVVGMVTASLVVATGSLEFTKYAEVGNASQSHLFIGPEDQLGLTWVSQATVHQLYLNYLDGAFQRILPTDITLNAPGDEPLTGYTAFRSDAIGVVYNVADPASVHWLVKMRVVSPTGVETVPAINLTPSGNSAYALAQAGVDATGFSAAWINISPPMDGASPPLEVRFARYDTTAGKLVGPITLDSDQPQPSGSTQGPQGLETLAELGIACNKAVCLVTYTRDVYNEEVELNIPKLFAATINIATGTLVGAPVPVEDTNWDTQMFGQNLLTLDDGSFLLVYTADDTANELNPVTACDSTFDRDLLYVVKFDATGALIDTPQPIFNDEGTREYPRIALHPDGYALFWEDQRSYCAASGGHIAMAMNVASPDLSSLLDPYLEPPGSIVLPPMDPTMAVTGTNFVVGWSDNRNGSGLLDEKEEIYLETYWRN